VNPRAGPARGTFANITARVRRQFRFVCLVSAGFGGIRSANDPHIGQTALKQAF